MKVKVNNPTEKILQQKKDNKVEKAHNLVRSLQKIDRSLLHVFNICFLDGKLITNFRYFM